VWTKVAKLKIGIGSRKAKLEKVAFAMPLC